MLVSIDKQSGESVESVLKKKRKATVRRICRFCTRERFSVWNDRMRGDVWWEWWVNETNGRSATHTTRWVRNGEISAWLMERTRKLIPDTRGSILRGTDLLLDLLSATGTHMPYGITQCYLPPGRGDIPALTSTEAGTRFCDPEGMQGWVDQGTAISAQSVSKAAYRMIAHRVSRNLITFITFRARADVILSACPPDPWPDHDFEVWLSLLLLHACYINSWHALLQCYIILLSVDSIVRVRMSIVITDNSAFLTN